MGAVWAAQCVFGLCVDASVCGLERLSQALYLHFIGVCVLGDVCVEGQSALWLSQRDTQTTISKHCGCSALPRPCGCAVEETNESESQRLVQLSVINTFLRGRKNNTTCYFWAQRAGDEWQNYSKKVSSQDPPSIWFLSELLMDAISAKRKWRSCSLHSYKNNKTNIICRKILGSTKWKLTDFLSFIPHGQKYVDTKASESYVCDAYGGPERKWRKKINFSVKENQKLQAFVA